ncbi:sensor histidine kinase [Streptomyces sp. NPDC101150]|uniref:sensor histidine kinase n=1 Tax=Streptomyces sp. NPDC101150 TaxID=3366114 RepID=UPI00380DA76A
MTISPRLRRAAVRLRRDILFIAAGVPLHLVTAALFYWLVVLLGDIVHGDDDPTTLIVPVPVVLVLSSNYVLTQAQRWRFRQLCGIDMPRPGKGHARQQYRYHCLAAPLLGALEALVVGLLVAGLVAALSCVWFYALPWQWRIEHLGYATQVGYVSAAGLAALAAVPGLAGGLVRLETRLVPTLLGRSREEELTRRVEDLTESRAGAVDAADAERRRIERDLHDGAQQRLVSLALNLGLAKATLSDLPPEAREVIDAAHREAKDAIEELNSLVRGLHPSVLDELGLDAALSGLAARAPLPVRLRVDIPADLPQRTSPAVEAVAYFVVSEALTNIAKHAREATRADVTVTRLGGILRVVIADDGVGGADPSKGTGLKGLAQRVGSVDGTFRMSSPVGGPTMMSVELPCPM